MKKITECGRIIMGDNWTAPRKLTFIMAFFLLCCAATNATAQAWNKISGAGASQTSKTFAVDSTGIPVTNCHSASEKADLVKSEKGHLVLYPDPVSDYLLVVLPAAAIANTLVTLRSMDGTEIATDTIAAGATNTVIDVKQVPHGMYVVTIDDTADKQISRLVKN